MCFARYFLFNDYLGLGIDPFKTLKCNLNLNYSYLSDCKTQTALNVLRYFQNDLKCNNSGL